MGIQPCQVLLEYGRIYGIKVRELDTRTIIRVPAHAGQSLLSVPLGSEATLQNQCDLHVEGSEVSAAHVDLLCDEYDAVASGLQRLAQASKQVRGRFVCQNHSVGLQR